jgi:Alanyl-tRNA synthetase
VTILKRRLLFLLGSFLTIVLKLDKDKLWITVYKDDDEAKEI